MYLIHLFAVTRLIYFLMEPCPSPYGVQLTPTRKKKPPSKWLNVHYYVHSLMVSRYQIASQDMVYSLPRYHPCIMKKICNVGQMALTPHKSIRMPHLYGLAARKLVHLNPKTYPP